MLRRIYIDNYACFTNFELQLQPLMLLAGRNGAGKTRLMWMLTAAPQLVIQNRPIEEILPPFSKTRWDSREDQTLEIDVELKGEMFTYRVRVTHDPTRLVEERLVCAGKLLFEFVNEEMRLYRDDGSAGSKFPAKTTHSGLASVPGGRQDNQKLTAFKAWLSTVWVIEPEPRVMLTESKREQHELRADLGNFASWYRYAVHRNPRGLTQYVEDLAPSIDGFKGLRFRDEGKTSSLVAQVESDGGESEYDLEELSDGQRLLLAYYALLRFAGAQTLLLDEPDNYLALREIQPWIVALRERIEEGSLQVIINSHHPELVDQLPVTWLFRDHSGPSRAEPLRIAPDQVLRPSELIARGWERGDADE